MRLLIFLFIFELFFDFNGKWLILGGISARHWLFGMVLAAVWGKAVYYLLKKFQSEKESISFGKFLIKELKSFRATPSGAALIIGYV